MGSYDREEDKGILTIRKFVTKNSLREEAISVFRRKKIFDQKGENGGTN